ncbi:DUF1834 family protein [Chitiniphilus eburneus]|uniref:DUF1834 family protein n=1 Tax=Chitiniphilus eburneus TaxID=2571148 RepID=UPI0035D11B60
MMIPVIEDAIVARLREGLGRMARQVCHYAGELDDDVANVIRALPAVWVTFGGVTRTEPTSTRRDAWLATGQFAVMVGERNLRNEGARRHGGPGAGEVGTYPLIYAVRRLLSGQDLGLPIAALAPGRVRTLHNSRVGEQAFSVFACEFDTRWMECALPLGTWPTPTGNDDPDALFARHHGRLDTPDPDWLSTELNYHLTPDDGRADARDILRSEP